MKMSLLFGILSMILPMASHAQELAKTELQKTYVEPSQLPFDKQRIFAYIEGQWIPVLGIHSDAHGMYVAYSKYPRSRWVCRASGCNYNNNGADETCQRVDEVTGNKCGAPRPPG